MRIGNIEADFFFRMKSCFELTCYNDSSYMRLIQRPAHAAMLSRRKGEDSSNPSTNLGSFAAICR